MLPLIRVIVKGMMDDYAERQVLVGRLATLDPEARPADRDSARALRADVETLDEKLVDAGHELGELGVEFKGIELGLVDFPARRGDQIVYLCWRYDEERIGYWHPVDAGYAGRRPIEGD